MKFLSRLRGKEEEAETDSSESRKYSGLGIFSPATGLTEPDPLRDCRRLAELDAIFVRSKRLESLDDVHYIVDQIREGNIVLLDISSLNDGHEQRYLELKRIVERIRGATKGYHADIALVNDGCIIVTPSFVRF
ncbi:MAG: cell division protein SepF [Candidatus Thorarchaeota archaeon]|nr:cell division protein SepF [Candidatus Thorarchaeota archaeon]